MYSKPQGQTLVSGWYFSSQRFMRAIYQPFYQTQSCVFRARKEFKCQATQYYQQNIESIEFFTTPTSLELPWLDTRNRNSSTISTETPASSPVVRAEENKLKIN